MKRVLLWVLGVVLVLTVAGAIVLSRIDTKFVVDQVAEATARATGTPLVFESTPSLSVLPPGVRFGAMHWGGIKDGQGMSVSARGGVVEVELAPLLSGNIVVHEISLDKPVIEVREAGAAAQAKAEPDRKAETAGTGGGGAPSDDLPVELVRLVVRQGEVRYVDAAGSTIALSDINLTVENLRRREEATIQSDFGYDWREPGNKPGMGGNLALSAKLRYYAPNLTFRQISITLTPVTGQLPREAGPIKLSCEGALNLQTMQLRLARSSLALAPASLTLEGAGSVAPMNFKGKFGLVAAPRKCASLAGITLPQGKGDECRLNCDIDYVGTSLALRNIAIQLDGTPLKGELALGLATPMSVTGSLQTGVIDLDRYLPVDNAATKDGKTASKPSAAQSKAAADSGKDLPRVNFRAALAGIRQGKLAVNDIAFIIKGEAGRYAISSLAANLGSGGALKGSGSIDLPGKAYGLKANASAVRLGGLLESLGKGRPVDGEASLDADITVRGDDAKAMMASLSGKGVLEMRNVTAQALKGMPQLPPVGGKSLSVPDRFDLVRVPFNASKGEVTAQPVTVSSPAVNATAQAHVSLPREHVDATASVKALGMNIPLVIQGPFGNVSVGVAPKFALEMAKQLPGTLLEGGKNAGGLLKNGAQGAGGAAQKGIQGAGGIVRGLLGR